MGCICSKLVECLECCGKTSPSYYYTSESFNDSTYASRHTHMDENDL